MTPFSQLERREQVIEIVRWICLLPAAVLTNTAAGLLGGALSQAMGNEKWSRFMLCYVLPKLALVLIGGKIAPRKQWAAAIGLAVLTVTMSLVIHLVGQYAAGNQVGVINYLHFGAESLGAVAGAILVALPARRAVEPSKSSD